MPGRRKRLGPDRMVGTSVHIPYAYLDRINELREKPSTFIREAIGEKLEREEGYIAAIARQESKLERLQLEIELVNTNIVGLKKKHEEWKKKNETSRIRDIVITEYLTGTHHTEQKLLMAVKPQARTTRDIKKIVHDIWIELKGAKGKKEILEDEGAITAI